MPKRQEKPYAAQVAAMSKPKLTNEIERLVRLDLAGEDAEECLRICIAEDETRGNVCYIAAIERVNTGLGYRRTGPTSFDLRETPLTQKVETVCRS
jgi:hypothetical protein